MSSTKLHGALSLKTPIIWTPWESPAVVIHAIIKPGVVQSTGTIARLIAKALSMSKPSTSFLNLTGTKLQINVEQEHLSLSLVGLKRYVNDIFHFISNIGNSTLSECTERSLKVALTELRAELEDASNVGSKKLDDLVHSLAFSGALSKPLWPSIESFNTSESEILNHSNHVDILNSLEIVAAVGMGSIPDSFKESDESFDLSCLATDFQYKGGFGCQVSSRSEAGSGKSYADGKLRLDSDETFIGYFHSTSNSTENLRGDIVAGVMQKVLGGTSAFSAGGPGKGMHSRLAKNIMERYPYVEEAISIYKPLSGKNSLFGITGATKNPKMAAELLKKFRFEMEKIAEKELSVIEAERARRHFKMFALEGFESAVDTCSNQVLQLIRYGEPVPKETISEIIDSVSSKEIRDFASKMLESKPTVAIWGDEIAKDDSEDWFSKL